MNRKMTYKRDSTSDMHCWSQKDVMQIHDLDQELKNKLPNEFKSQFKMYNYTNCADGLIENDIYLNGSKLL